MAGGDQMSPVSRRKLFSSLGADAIFEVIEDAIAVAAHNHPHELEQRWDSILQMLHAARASTAAAATTVDESAPVSGKNGSASSDEAVPLSEQVARIKGQLVGEEDGRPISGETALESLRALQAVRMTFETLEATKIGRAVSGLRKHASEQVRELAGDLYKCWKALADGHFRSSRTSPPSSNTAGAAIAADVEENTDAPKPTPPTSKPRSSTTPPASTAAAASIAAVAKAKTPAPKPTPTSKPSSSNQETPPASHARETPKIAERVRGSSPAGTAPATKAMAVGRQPKPSCSSAVERKEAPTIIDEARLATAKRKLHERYEKEATVKKQRRIQLIDAPKQRCVVRRHTVAVAGKRAPAPSSLRMCRAS